MVEFNQTRCKGKAAFILDPNKKKKLNLMKLELPFKILARTPAMLVLDVEGTQVNLYPTGKMLVRSDKPLPIAEEIFKCLE